MSSLASVQFPAVETIKNLVNGVEALSEDQLSTLKDAVDQLFRMPSAELIALKPSLKALQERVKLAPELQSKSTCLEDLNAIVNMCYVAKMATAFKDLTEPRLEKLNARVFQLLQSDKALPKLRSSLMALRLRTDAAQPSPEQKMFAQTIAAFEQMDAAQDLPQELKNHPAFHASFAPRALARALQILRASTDPKSSLNLPAGRNQYLSELFASANGISHYLLRISASRSSTANEKYFTCSFSGPSDYCHIRAVYQPDMKMPWRLEKGSTCYSTLQALISRLMHCKKELSNHAMLTEEGDCVGCDRSYYLEDLRPQMQIDQVGAEPMEDDVVLRHLYCPITKRLFQKPCTTKDGQTYSEKNIRLKMTEEPDKFKAMQFTLVENRLLARILVARQAMLNSQTTFGQVTDGTFERISDPKEWQKDRILQLFADRLNEGRMIETPVLAPDGVTYDRATLISYLEVHDNRLPFDNTVCSSDDLIEDPIAKQILNDRIRQLEERSQIIQSHSSTSASNKIVFEPKQEDLESDIILTELICPITRGILSNPHTTPGGHTYSHEMIVMWANQNGRDPTTSALLSSSQLVSNKLALHILEVRMNMRQQLNQGRAQIGFAHWSQDPILRLFADPITNNMIATPVLAPNGITYDKATITTYLKQSGNFLPDGTPCFVDILIPNIVVIKVLQARKAQIHEITESLKKQG